MAGIQFSGIATGLDTGMIVSQLVELKRAPIYRLEKRKKNFQAQQSSLAILKTKLLALQEAAKKLDTTREFSSLKSSSSDEDYLTVKANSDAAPGSHTVEVRSLATAQRDSSQGYASLNDSIGSGIMSFTVNGETTDLNLTGYTSIEALKDLINNDVDGVSATIINTGSETDPYRLVLSSTDEGSANAFSVDVSGLSGGATPLFTNDVTAEDAHLIVDGIEVYASSNSSDEVISGVTLNLVNVAEDNTRVFHVNIDVDTEGIGENVNGMVDAYNDLFSYIKEQSGAEGDLRSNPTLRSVASRMENVFSSSLSDAQGDFSMFAQIGISRGDGRTLNWSQEDFTEALEQDFNSVRDLFVRREGNVGKSYLIDQAIDDMTDSMSGLFKISQDALSTKIDNADSSIERYERSVESYQRTIERKFTAMEMMVAQLQAQGNYLSSVMY